MSKFDLQKIKRGILCCMTHGSCRQCPYVVLNNEKSTKWEESCQYFLEKDIDEIFLRFEILNDNG